MRRVDLASQCLISTLAEWLVEFGWDIEGSSQLSSTGLSTQ
jgi:hypothetical protein